MEGPNPQNYQSQLEVLKKHEIFYCILLWKYKICTNCTYRIFNIMTPKLYSDENNNIEIMRKISSLTLEKCKNANISESYKFITGQFKLYCQDYCQNSSNSQKGTFCWLCSGILQKQFLQNCCKHLINKVKQEHYQHKQKYKLNVKIHNIFAIKFQVFCNLVLAELQKQQLITAQQIQQIRKLLILPLFQKTGLDIKTIFKWKLSNIVNHQPGQIFDICSTINQDQKTVIISLEVQHKSQLIQKQMTNLLGPYLQFQKLKEKKGRIQLQENKNYLATWTVALINKINDISKRSWAEMLQSFDVSKIAHLQKTSSQFLNIKIGLQSQNILFSGRYVKFSRYLSQTPWVINKERLIHSSLQDQIQKRIIGLFYPAEVKLNEVQVKFHAGGREDIDVRMLKCGRPFVIQFVNPRYCLSDISLHKIVQKIKIDLPQQSKNLPEIDENIKYTQQELQMIKCTLLQFYINNSTQVAKVNNFRKSNTEYISKQLKQAQVEKIKHYVCYIKSVKQFTNQDKITLQKCYNLPVLQKTPIRVLHRRTLMFRDKVVHKMIFHQATKYTAVLQIWASAGTYIKQFVHGDLNRTIPNVGFILKKQIDILQLDVGSLKQGQWAEGDDQVMKLGVLPWQKIN